MLHNALGRLWHVNQSIPRLRCRMPLLELRPAKRRPGRSGNARGHTRAFSISLTSRYFKNAALRHCPARKICATFEPFSYRSCHQGQSSRKGETDTRGRECTLALPRRRACLLYSPAPGTWQTNSRCRKGQPRLHVPARPPALAGHSGDAS